MMKKKILCLLLGIAALPVLAQNQDFVHDDSLCFMNPVCEFLSSPNGGEVRLNQRFAGYKHMAPVWDGTQSEETSVFAKGVSLNKKGTGFSGYAGYGRGVKLNTAWSDVADAPEFYPYLIADSIGGDYKFERYLLGGAFHMQHKNHKLALRIDYDGSIHWRSTDPRPKNTISNIGMTMGYVYKASFGLLGAAVSVESRKQHVDIRIDEDKRKDRFYHLLGMGLFDHRYSTVESSLTRYYIGNGLKAELSYARQTDCGWYARLQFEHSKMNVEESDTRISAFSKKLCIASSIGYQLLSPEHYRWDNRLDFIYRDLKGFEQVYKMEQSNTQTGVFIPVLLDKSRRTTILQPHVAFHSTLHLSERNLFRRIGALIGWNAFKEMYNPWYRKWSALRFGANYKLAIPVKAHCFEIAGGHEWRLNLTHSLHVPDQNRISREMIEPDFRYFTRNALYNEIVFSYHHQLKSISISPLVRLQGEFASESRKALALSVGFKLNM